jgi:hypothetical protein
MPGKEYTRDYLRKVLKDIQELETAGIDARVKAIAESFKAVLEDYRHLVEESAKKPVGGLPILGKESPTTLLDIRDQLEEWEARLLNMGSYSIGLYHDDPPHYIILARATEGGIPTIPRKFKIPEDAVKKLLSGEITSYPCPIDNKPAKLIIRAGDPSALALYKSIREIREDVIDKYELPRYAEKAPFYPWASKVKYLGPAAIVKLGAIIETSLRRHVVLRASSVWRLAGLAPISVCPECGLIDETPAAHNHMCPRCGVLLVDYAPSKYNIEVIRQRIREIRRGRGEDVNKVTVVRFNEYREEDFNTYITHVMGRPRFMSYMYVVADQYRPMPNKKPSVYTVVALELMLKSLGRVEEARKAVEEAQLSESVVDKVIEELRRRHEEKAAQALSKAREKGGIGTATLYNRLGIWRRVAKLLLEHAVAVTMILSGTYQGPPPTVQKQAEKHVYYPPLIDVELDKAMEDTEIQAVIKWYDRNMGMDLPNYWARYQYVRDHNYVEMYDELLKRIEQLSQRK